VEERRDDPDLVRLEDYGAFKLRKAQAEARHAAYDLSRASEAMSVRYRRMKGRPSYSSRGRRTLGKATKLVRASAYAQARGRAPAAANYARGRLSGGELKAVDYPLAAASVWSVIIDSSPDFQLLNGVQAGAGYFNRIGKRIKMKSIHIVGHIIPSGNATTNTAEYLRCLLVYDRQPGNPGAVPGGTDVLQDRDNVGNTNATSYAGPNLDNSDRFMIIRDWRIAVPANGNAAAISQQTNGIVGQQENKVNWFVDLKGLETVFKQTTNPAGIGDITTGTLLFMTFGSLSAANQPGYIFQGKSRLRFYD